jgi:hypothetical protein
VPFRAIFLVMSLFDFVLFLHIAVVLFAISLAGVLHVAEHQASRATTVAELRVVSRPYKYGVLFAPVVILLLGLGMWLVHLSKGEFHVGDGWAWTAIVALGLLFLAGPTVMGRHAVALKNALADLPDGPVSPEVHALVMQRASWVVGNASTTLALGVVFNMTTKPSTGGAILVLVIATAVGALLGYAGSQRGAMANA